MKLRKFKFNNHEILDNLEIDFTDNNENVLSTIVMIGENGVGKTTLLRTILFEFSNLDYGEFGREGSIGVIRNINKELEVEFNDDNEYMSFLSIVKGHNELNKSRVKVVYMPSEVNFDKVKKVDNTFKLQDKFLNIIDQNITENIPSFIATRINKEIFRNMNRVIGEAIKQVCDEINSIFDIMELDVELIGLSADEDTKPVFKNSLGKEFDINGLSSGEKQLFLRALSLKFLYVNNSIILIDEPEISLHPTWQQKIINVYENIGENNQIIIATHSPHIIENIKPEQLRTMRKDENGVCIV